MQKIKLYDSPRLRLLFLCLSVALAVTIFLFSAEPATESADRSTGLAEIVLSLCFPAWNELPQGEQEALLAETDHLLRKTAHFCVYAALGALLCLTSLGFWAKRYVHALRSLIIGALYAISDEVHQAFVPGRGPGIGDVILDSIGVLVGILAILLLAKIIIKRKNRC